VKAQDPRVNAGCRGSFSLERGRSPEVRVVDILNKLRGNGKTGVGPERAALLRRARPEDIKNLKGTRNDVSLPDQTAKHGNENRGFGS